MQTIPNEVIVAIVSHRPHLSRIAENLKSMPKLAAVFEKAIAIAYCQGETRLSAMDTYRLSACVTGDKFGGGSRR